MTLTFEMETVADGYRELCYFLMNWGKEVAPRGQRTKEILNPVITLHNPACALPVGIGRGCKAEIGAVEAVQLCGAFSDPHLTAMLSPFYASLREPRSGMYHGAYGVRIRNQLEHVGRKLMQDPDTRQAVITLWDPDLDNFPGKKDYPCTVSLQFYIRDGQLHLSTNMRSNDIWLGLAYDLFQFGQLQWTLANMLNIRAGTLVHRPVSLHIYEKHWEDVDKLTVQHGPGAAPFLYGFDSVQRAFAIGRGMVFDDATPTEMWYQAILSPMFDELEKNRT